MVCIWLSRNRAHFVWFVSEVKVTHTVQSCLKWLLSLPSAISLRDSRESEFAGVTGLHSTSNLVLEINSVIANNKVISQKENRKKDTYKQSKTGLRTEKLLI